jgi:hypothetical protein
MKPQLRFRRLIGPIVLLLLIGHVLTLRSLSVAPEQALNFAAGRAAAQAAGAPVCGGTFTTTADTFVNQSAPTTNYGTTTQLVVGKGSGAEQRALLLFDILRVIPPGATIHKAELQLSLAGAPAPTPFKIEVREAAGAWVETTVNWNNQPALGAHYGAASHIPTNNLIRIDVTTLVTRWHTSAISNTGLMLLPADATSAIPFVSRNSPTGGPPPNPPKLMVQCATPDDLVGRDQTQADQKQTAGLALLKQRSSKPATLQVRRGALNFAELDLTVPQNVGGDALARAQWFLGTYKDALRLADPTTELQLARRSRDGQHLFFRQRHSGIPVLPAMLGVHLDGAHVRGLGGSYVPEITTPSTPRLTARQAESLAAAMFGDGSVRPGELGDGSVRPTIEGDTQLRYLNLGLFGRDDTNTYLTWEVHVTGGAGPASLFFDAFDGQLRYKQLHTMHDFDLEYLSTAKHDTSSSCFIFVDTDEWFDENGVISGANPDAEGFTAFNNIKTVYNYWRNRFGRDSYDDDGEEIEMYIHVGQNYRNAAYVGGICDIFQFGDGFPIRDVVGHEFTHAVDNSEGELEYETQSGALDESFADIFGHFVDTGNWLLGEGVPGANSPVGGLGCTPTAALRDMSNPPCHNQPDHMQASKSGDGQGLRKLPSGTDPECDSSDPNYNDCGFVHTNSGINNKAAFLIINGGTHNGIPVTALGTTKAERLFYNVLVNWLWDSAQLIDARNAAVAEATWQFAQGNFTLNDVCQVKNAYGSVGLGSGDINCDGQEDNVDPDNDGDGVDDGPDNCNNIANPSQSDIDGDGLGDVCDPDIDGDGDLNGADNCQYVSNANQADWNNDGQGDKCDDSDNDTVKDSTDNCRTTANTDQKNTDGDSQGDACDTDDDNDGVPDTTDNCHFTYNPDQKDSDGDGIGDACDKCPAVSSPDNGDPDGDGLGNPCDTDDDNDGIPDGQDICPLEPGLGCLDIGNLVATDVFINMFSRFPIPNCIVCGGEYLPPGQEVMVDVTLPVGFQARIVDSSGRTVAKGQMRAGGKLDLNFEPAAFGGPQGAATHVQAAAVAAPQPDEMRYYLDILPAPGVDTSKTYPVTITVTEGNPSTLFLPITRR